MDMGRIPGSVKVKWRRVRDRGATADLLRLQNQTEETRVTGGRERKVQGLRLPKGKGRQLAREKVQLLTGNFTGGSSEKVISSIVSE